MNSIMQENIIVPVALFAMAVLLVWIGHKVKRARMQEQGELRKRVLLFRARKKLAHILVRQVGNYGVTL
jgi:hypothetical protein